MMQSTDKLAEGISSFFFGDPGRPLFGSLYRPSQRSSIDCGFLLNYPMGYEYFRCHRAYRLLAEQLHRAGFSVLRFDFHGCGDSSGVSDEARIEDWLSDVVLAAAELKRLCGVTRVCLLGSRLAAPIAWLAGAGQTQLTDQMDVAGVVLWDPVISGSDYLHEMRTRHQTMLRISHVVPDKSRSESESIELLGFQLGSELQADIEGIDLHETKVASYPRTLFVSSKKTDQELRFKEQLEQQNASSEYSYLPDQYLWDWTEDVGHAIVPSKILKRILDWSKEVVAWKSG